MSLRRLHREQPESFAFTPGNLAWAEQQMTKYPEGRQMSAVIPLLWRAQEQEGWITRPMIHEIARMLGMDPIRVLEVASFYFMFHLQPVGSLAHIQVCGTTSCMLCGSEDLMAVCREKIATEPHEISADGRFSWEEVECLGACANAPMVQIGKDYYEDLTAESFAGLLDALARGEVPRPGSQTGRYASEPVIGRTSLTGDVAHEVNASLELALAKGDTIMRITGEDTGMAEAEGQPGQAPELMTAPRGGEADDLKKISGVGPKLEELLNEIGVWHFDQIAGWGPAEIAWIEDRCEAARGRVERDDWVGQARGMAKPAALDSDGPKR